MTLTLKIKQFSTVLSVTILLMSLSGCQITQSQQSAANLGSYYLWLNQLSTEQLTQELALQQNQSKQPFTDVYLAILYSRPKSGFYNPYRAKTILNKLTEPNKAHHSFSAYHLPANDLAFLSMLKEQLNEQLLAIEKTISKEQKMHLMQQHIHELNHDKKRLKQQNDALKDSNLLLLKKIKQLKKIEQAINKRGS